MMAGTGQRPGEAFALAPITYVSDQLGHTDSATTLRVYAHRIPRGRRWVEIPGPNCVTFLVSRLGLEPRTP